MRVVITVMTGMDAERKLWLEPGQSSIVGSDANVDFVIHDDSEISPRHFLLECRKATCQIRNLDVERELRVNKRLTIHRSLMDGDRIIAGQTLFSVQIENPNPSVQPPAISADHAKSMVCDFLMDCQPLFALLDAAQSPQILAFLLQSHCPFQNLYEGPQGEALALVAPYLVQLNAEDSLLGNSLLGNSLLAKLIAQGWGKSWGMFLTSRAPLAEIRKHFRRYLMIEKEDGTELYFRFYDPRVLRVFLPGCLPEEARLFLGPVESLWLEEAKGMGLLRFSMDDPVFPQAVPLEDPASLAQTTTGPSTTGALR